MKLIVTLSLLLLTTPALAGTFSAPDGCKAYLTVQSRGCMVSHFYTCEKDAKGEQWRADFDDMGPFFLSRIDSEAQWLESYESDGSGSGLTTKETMDANPKDAASFSGLMSTGLDTFDFSLTKSSGEHTNINGYDKLTGSTAKIDGVVLQQTEYEYTQTDDTGKVMRHAKGNEFVSPEWHTFFSGHSQYELDDGTWAPQDGAPISYANPGEPGFDTTTPIFECNAESAALEQTLISLKDPAK